MRAKAFFNSKNGIKTTLNSCELAEFLLAHKTLKINSQKRYAISEIKKLIKMPLAEISQEITNLNLAEEAIATILRHI